MASVLVRPVSVDDFEALVEIDEVYAEAYGLEPVMTRSSLNFYARSAHSFASLESNKPSGFVFAQSVWNGTRPTVQIYRLAVNDVTNQTNGISSREALFEAVIKSAYDAAVYDLQMIHHDADERTTAILKRLYKKVPASVYTLTLGSRGGGELG